MVLTVCAGLTARVMVGRVTFEAVTVRLVTTVSSARSKLRVPAFSLVTPAKHWS